MGSCTLEGQRTTPGHASVYPISPQSAQAQETVLESSTTWNIKIALVHKMYTQRQPQESLRMAAQITFAQKQTLPWMQGRSAKNEFALGRETTRMNTEKMKDTRLQNKEL